ncbi:MAG: acyl-CoA thioesterase [Gemmataceae bacterium]|nr:acyl-CoA thioesterase [Gemmataceae bacterium]
MADPFRTRRRVEFVDTDLAGIAHFSNFFRWMESAEVEFLRSLGLSVKLQWEDLPLGFPRVSASCDYAKPARFEDVLDIAVTVAKIGRKSVTYAFEFSTDGELVARGRVSSVCCRVLSDQQIESIEIPAGVRALLEQAAR